MTASAKQVFSRLSWIVDDSIDTFTALSGLFYTTNRKWVGTLNENENTFTIMETRKLIYVVPIQLVVKGKIREYNGKSLISIKINPGWFTAIFSIFIFLVSIGSIVFILTYFGLGNFIRAVIPAIVFGIPWTLFLHFRLNKLENKLDTVFNID